VDIEERNRQVQLMAYILPRAKKVIVWLGPTGPNHLIDQERGAKSLTPETVEEVCTRPYWKRVWIVQEIGAATQIQVRWGTKSDSWDAFFQYVVLWGKASEIAPALKLSNQRKGRHGNNFLLANFMKACRESLCEELRDKVYG
jgi:hypothetical protein